MGNEPIAMYEEHEHRNDEMGAEDYVVRHTATAHMHFVAAVLFGVWYSTIFAFATTAGVKDLYRETPGAHGLLESVALALGSGIGIALASRLAKTHRVIVGICLTFIPVSIWIALLFSMHAEFEEATGQSVFGHPLSARQEIMFISSLTLLVGLASTFLGARSGNDDELADQLLMIPSRHWLWLWIAGFAWVYELPHVAYYCWLQVATALYSMIHPSLWFHTGSGLLLGTIGTVALLFGIQISLKAVSDKSSYGGAVWKRVLMFLVGTIILASAVTPFSLNIEIDRLKDIPGSLGAHPWWVL